MSPRPPHIPYPLPPPPSDQIRNLLVRQFIKQQERRFSGEPITGFGQLEQAKENDK